MSYWYVLLYLMIYEVCCQLDQCVPASNGTDSFWLLNASIPSTSIGSLPSNDSIIDVTIIGCGISGSSVAYYLSQYLNTYNSTSVNITNVLLVDARGPSTGASGRNAGALRVITDSQFASTLNKYGYETAIKYYNFTLDTVNKVITLLNSNNDNVLPIQNGFRAETFLSISDISKRNDSINLMQHFGYGMSEKLISNPHYLNNILNIHNNSPFVGGVYGPDMYNINPSLIVSTLLNNTILNSNNTLHIDEENKMNLNIQYKSMVNSVIKDKENEYYNINITENKQHIHRYRIIKSKIVVFATNAYSSNLLPQFKSLIIPRKSQVVMSKPYNLSFWNNITGIFTPEQYLTGHYTYYYYGQYQDYDKRVLILGFPENQNDCDDSYVETNFSDQAQKFLMDNYPALQSKGFEMDIAWTAMAANTKDGYPYIGPIVNMPNCYICAGFNGLGLSQALNGGNSIASMIVGQAPAPFLDIFLPQGRMDNAHEANDDGLSTELIIVIVILCILGAAIITILVVVKCKKSKYAQMIDHNKYGSTT